MVNEIKRVGIGNFRDGSLGAWRIARSSHSVCAESMCFEIPTHNDRCRAHHAKASQSTKRLNEEGN